MDTQSKAIIIAAIIGALGAIIAALIQSRKAKREKRRADIAQEEVEKLDLIARQYRCASQYLKNIEAIYDEYHRFRDVNCIFTIRGSDCEGETRMKGFNNHPEGRNSNELPLYIAGDVGAEEALVLAEVYDNKHGVPLEPTKKLISENLAVYVVRYPSTKVGDDVDFTIKRRWKGCIIKKVEYVFVGVKHYLRGVEFARGTIIFDRRPLSYWASALSESGNIEKVAISLNFNEKENKLEFEILNPKTLYIINLELSSVK